MNQVLDLEEHFKQGVSWYNQVFICKISERSYCAIICSIVFLLVIILGGYIRLLFPIVNSIGYSLYIDNIEKRTSEIVPANSVVESPRLSIAQILLENYVLQREKYDYHSLDKQIVFVKNTSSKSIFNEFNNYLNLSNPNSPIIRYQKESIRTISIVKSKFQDNKIIITFTSKATDSQYKLFEHLKWEATITFEMDQIDVNKTHGSDFYYYVTDYNLKLKKDYLENVY